MSPPDPNQPSTWILLISLACAVISAFGPKKHRDRLLKMRDKVIMIPWILFAGSAAENTRYWFTYDSLGLSDIQDHPAFNFERFIPIAGIAIVLIPLLFWIGMKRKNGNAQSTPLIPHLFSGLFLIWHAMHTQQFYAKVAETYGPFSQEVENGLDSSVSILATLFACCLLAIALLKLRIAEPALGSRP